MARRSFEISRRPSGSERNGLEGVIRLRGLEQETARIVLLVGPATERVIGPLAFAVAVVDYLVRWVTSYLLSRNDRFEIRLRYPF